MNGVRQLLVITVLLLATVEARAQNVFVTAGEHDEFTRVFLGAPEGTNWDIATGPTSIEITSTAPITGFNLTRAYERISDARIREFEVVSPTTLRIKLACACQADAADWGQGDLVVDIRNKVDGSINDVSTMERATPGGPKYDWLSGISRNVTNPTYRQWPSEPEMPDEYVLAQVDLGQPRRKLDKDNRVHSFKQASFPSFDRGMADVAVLPGQALEIPVATEPAPDEALAKEFQNALLGQLQRAASQGVINFPPSSIKSLRQNDPAEGIPTTVANAGLADTPSPFPNQPATMQQMLVTNALETAIDKDIPPSAKNSAACLPREWFDPNSWAPTNSSSGLAGLRAALVGEFDKPDAAAVTRLARYYLYLGFGLEARQVVNTFPVEKDQVDIIYQIAGILDQENSSTFSALANQIGCNPDATLWGLLVLPARSVDPDVELSKVLAVFSGYPIHLRNLIGPTLAGIFVEFGKKDEAIAVRNLIARSEDADTESVNLISAEIEIAAGDVEAGSALLGEVVSQDSTKSAEALIKLISERQSAGLSVESSVASAADALAVEYRGTELGRQLTEAAIRAFSISGQPQITFSRIHEAERRASISDATIVTLTNEAFADAAKNADDVVFLRLVHTETLPEIRTSEPIFFRRDEATRNAVADRLIELKFFDKAASVLEPLASNANANSRLRLANIAYGNGRYQTAIELLAGQYGKEAQDIRANAAFQMGNYADASAFFEEVGAKEQAMHAAWISGDFARAAGMDTRPVSKLIDAVLDSTTQIESLDGLETPLSTLRMAKKAAEDLRAIVEQAIN